MVDSKHLVGTQRTLGINSKFPLASLRPSISLIAVFIESYGTMVAQISAGLV